MPFLGASRRALRTAIVFVAALAVTALWAPPAQSVAEQGQFVIRCPYSHTLADDPIVHPGHPGASHLHDFFGNTTVHAGSTVSSMLAGETTCRVPSDTAGYWAPTAFLNGQRIVPTVMRVYYLGTTSGNVETIPAGLEMIGGNRDAINPDQNPHVRWSCGETRSVKTPRSKTPYDCTPWAEQHAFVDGVIAVVDMPSCWDGQGLEPENVIYPVGGSCPANFRHRLPRISERIHYGIMNPLAADGSVALTFSNGDYWAYHADFWNTWQQARLDQLVEECLVAGTHCGAVDASGQVEWIRQFGTTRYDLAYAVATDDGGSYVAGFTNFALDGQDYRHRYDAFVRKYDPDGNVVWTRQFGTSGVDQVLAITADGGGVTVVGSTEGRFPGQQPAGGSDAFAARFTATGDFQWLRQFGTRRDDRATSVAGGGAGIFVGGTTEGTLGASRSGGKDAFVARLDASGGAAWIEQFGTARGEAVSAMTLRSGTLYAVGWTAGPLGGPFRGGASDGFLAAFDTDGVRQWRRQIGTAGADRILGVVARAQGVFIAGSTDGVLPEQTASGGLDAFAGKIGIDGQPLWYRQFGSPADDEAVAVEAGPEGVYVAGSANGLLPDGEHLGEWDGFVRRFLPNGTQIWTRQLGTDDYDRVYGLAFDADGLYLAGTTHGVFEGETYAGDRDVFVLRLAFS
jgi:hypothetical protein